MHGASQSEPDPRECVVWSPLSACCCHSLIASCSVLIAAQLVPVLYTVSLRNHFASPSFDRFIATLFGDGAGKVHYEPTESLCLVL